VSSTHQYVARPVTLNHFDKPSTSSSLFMQQKAFTEAASFIISSSSHLACFSAHFGTGHAAGFLSMPPPVLACPMPQGEGAHVIILFLLPHRTSLQRWRTCAGDAYLCISGISQTSISRPPVLWNHCSWCWGACHPICGHHAG
jgi:hypothetical protein